MKIYTLGVDQLIVSQLKDSGLDMVTVTSLPDKEVVKEHLFICTSEHVPYSDLSVLIERYEGVTIIYQYIGSGLKNNQHIKMLCESNGMHFIDSRATFKTFLNKLNMLLNKEVKEHGNLIGFFGSGAGIGLTSIAASFAKQISHQYKVIMLGLNLFNGGWDVRSNVNLENWKPKLVGKTLTKDDFENLLVVDGFKYLPGNFDILSIDDYHEEEFEYLLEESKKHSDIVIADFGVIPMSAAWYVGMQHSNVKYMVSVPTQAYRIQQLLDVVNHLGVTEEEFLMVINRADRGSGLSSKNFSQQTGIPLALEINELGIINEFSLPVGKKESNLITKQLESFVQSLEVKQDGEEK